MKKTALLVSMCFFAMGSNANDNQPAIKQSLIKKTTPKSVLRFKERTSHQTKKLSEYLIEDYTKIANKNDLIQHFGKDSLQEGVSSYHQGDVSHKHIVVTNKETNQKIKYLLTDDEKNVTTVEFFNTRRDKEDNFIRQKPIKSENGISIGMNLKDLFQWNDNEPIYFFGFGWEFGGVVMHSDNYQKPSSKLAKSKFTITLNYNDGLGNYPYNFLGDVELSTNDEKTLNSPIFVESITIYLAEYTKDTF